MSGRGDMHRPTEEETIDRLDEMDEDVAMEAAEEWGLTGYVHPAARKRDEDGTAS
jgi:hypothetical protein